MQDSRLCSSAGWASGAKCCRENKQGAAGSHEKRLNVEQEKSRTNSTPPSPLPDLPQPPAPPLPLTLCCSISCLGHHVLRQPASTVSPLRARTHTHKGGTRGGSIAEAVGDEGKQAHVHLAAAHAHREASRRLRARSRQSSEEQRTIVRRGE